jgi:BolA protein
MRMAPMSVAERLRVALTDALAPERVEVDDASLQHHGHAGWREGGETHFHVIVVARCFEGRSRVERQRLVYAAAAELLRDRIHALSISALAPGEPEPRR